MIHTIKNYKWVIATSLICITFGLLTFFTFINQSFITLNDLNLQILLFADLFLLVLFYIEFGEINNGNVLNIYDKMPNAYKYIAKDN